MLVLNYIPLNKFKTYNKSDAPLLHVCVCVNVLFCVLLLKIECESKLRENFIFLLLDKMVFRVVASILPRYNGTSENLSNGIHVKNDYVICYTVQSV